jgi:hypothetical protein
MYLVGVISSNAIPSSRRDWDGRLLSDSKRSHWVSTRPHPHAIPTRDVMAHRSPRRWGTYGAVGLLDLLVAHGEMYVALWEAESPACPTTERLSVLVDCELRGRWAAAAGLLFVVCCMYGASPESRVRRRPDRLWYKSTSLPRRFSSIQVSVSYA